MFYKIISASLVTASFSIAAMAQTNLQAESTRIMDNWSGPFDALSIHVCLDRSHKSFTGSALQEAFTVEQNRIVKLLNRGDSVKAAGLADSMIKAFGHCYTVSDKQAALPTYARYMGGFIATDALVYDNDDKMQQAITLLDYANQHGQTNTEFLDLVKEHRKSESESGEIESHSLKTLYDGVNANYPRFKRDYEGKPVTVSGVVSDIGERDWPKKSVWVTINTGVKTEFASCYLTEDQFDKAYDLDKGQKVTVEGVVKSYDLTVANGFSLKNCKIG